MRRSPASPSTSPSLPLPAFWLVMSLLFTPWSHLVSPSPLFLQGDEEPDEEEPSEPLDIPFSALTNILLNDAGMDDTRVRLELRVAGVAQHEDR